MKVETDIITSITVESDRTSCGTTVNACRDIQNWQYFFLINVINVFDGTLTYNFQYCSQSLDTDNINRRDQRCFMVSNATFNNISVISLQSVLLVEKTGVPGENYFSVASQWQILSHNVLSSTLRYLPRKIRIHNFSALIAHVVVNPTTIRLGPWWPHWVQKKKCLNYRQIVNILVPATLTVQLRYRRTQPSGRS